MRILVTGAAGFIGSHLTEGLLADGHAVVGLDDFDSFYPRSLKERYVAGARAHPDFALVEGDVRRGDDLERAAAAATRLGAREASFGVPFDAVVHLAALVGVRPSIDESVRYESVNVGGTARLLEYCREQGIGRLVFGSSSSIYGNTEEVPFREEQDVGHPISPYAATKRSAELLCHTSHHLDGLGVLCLRLFTVYGPRQRPDLAIHKFARLIAECRPLTRYGDGTTRRDYTYVDDVVEGIVRALAYLEREPDTFEIVNIGNSETVELNRLIELIGEAMEMEPEIEQLAEQPGDVRQTWADTTKARELLGWRSRISIEEGIDRFVSWFRKHADLLTESRVRISD